MAAEEDLKQETAAPVEEKRKGQLKIFFGYAAGVGKTYTMLEAAHDAKRRGVDIVAGYIEPHTRPETMALLEGLELLPNKIVPHGGIELKEFDLDGALTRHPELILVDELAHSNAPGCRHEKRYQDVEELLNAGIDVYTTINVQHIESLNDTVASITGIAVRERIPDSVFDRADQVEIVDIEPQDLIGRLKEGKIYRMLQAHRAMEHFFTAQNLMALREIALRRCADRVNRRGEARGLRGGEEYHTEEHVLVCLSSSPSNAKIIRTAARMSQAFQGKLTALFVETPDFPAMSQENLQRLRSNMRLAEQLGARIETVYGTDVPFQIAEFARISGVSKIVIGRSAAKGKLLGKQNLTERLISNAPQLDIHIIPDAASNAPYHVKHKLQTKASFSDLIKSLGILIAATLIGFLFYQEGFEEANIIIVYVLGVLLTSVVTTNRAFSLASSVVSVLVFNFFFTDPRFSLEAYGAGYPVTFLVMFLAALMTSSLAVKLKEHAKQSAVAAFRTKILFDINQSLQHAESRDEILFTTASHLNKLLGKDIVVYPVEDGRLLPVQVHYADPAQQENETLYTSDSERAVALWVLKNNKHAGATTQTLSDAHCLYLAARLNDKVYAVVGIAADKEPMETAEKSIMLSILGECALALENEQNLREKKEAAILAQNEKLRANLLRSISHDLRTPLTSISGNASNLLSNGDGMDAETKQQIYGDIYDDSMWLINLVENLLSVTRLEENHLNLHITSELVADVIEEAMHHIDRRAGEHHITVRQENDLLLAKMDPKLIVQVLINIVDNAIKYTPAGSSIELSTRAENGMAVISVADDGEGVSEEMKAHIFDRFYSGANQVADSRRSLGLGLSLCKSIVTAHAGELTVSDNVPHGTVFTFTLPMEEVKLYE